MSNPTTLAALIAAADANEVEQSQTTKCMIRQLQAILAGYKS